jgi:hypothetical protein
MDSSLLLLTTLQNRNAAPQGRGVQPQYALFRLFLQTTSAKNTSVFRPRPEPIGMVENA